MILSKKYWKLHLTKHKIIYRLNIHERNKIKILSKTTGNEYSMRPLNIK